MSSEDPPIRNDVRNGQMALSRSGGKPVMAGGSGGLAVARSEDQFNRRTGPGVPNVWKIAHSAWRGRYLLVTGLGIVSAAALGVLAFRFTAPPTYTSEGLVRIAYTLPVVRETTDQNEAMPQFETFMQSQKTLITSRRTIENAAQDPVWKTLPKAVRPTDPDLYFAKHLTVDVKPKSELIHFQVSDRDAQTAAAAVTAMINAYSEMYNSQDTKLDRHRLELLEVQQKDLQGKIEQLNEQIRAKAAPYGTADLDPLFQGLQDTRTKRENALNDIRITMAESATGPMVIPTDPSAAARLAKTNADALTIEQIVAVDPTVRTYWEQQARAQDDVDRLTKYGYGPSHRLMVTAVRTLEDAQARTQRSADEYRKTHAAPPAGSYEQRSVAGAPGRSLGELKQIEANLSRLLDETRSDMITLGNTRMDLQRMNTMLASERAELSGVSKRIEILQGEGALGGRLSVISRGEVSLVPSADLRWRAAGVAGLGGFFLPAIAMMGISLARRRYRYSDEPGADVLTSRVPLLGMLPNVPARGAPPSLRVAAAYAAHHLRVLLSSRATTVVRRTFLVTSAGEGEGKTTVTMALAISFAASKHRTLVIDGDFVGRRLTRGFNAEQQEGLFESMGHGDIDGQWLNAASNLCILPTGKVDAADACGITAENVRLLLEQAVQHFDVVLIDTGSILGSPESAVLAREVDGVIVTISRGQKQSQVKKAMLRLEALGAAVVGRVFNKANAQDFESSYVTPTSGWNEPAPAATGELSELQQRVANFGPLVRAVAAAVPSEGIHHEGARIGSSEHVTRT